MPFTAIDDEPKGFTLIDDKTSVLDNAVSDIGDIVKGTAQTIKNVATAPYDIPYSIYQTGQQLMQGQPISQTNLGQQAQQAMQIPGQIYDRVKQIVTHPIQSFEEHPVKTALDVGSVIAPIAGSLLPETSMAEMAANSGKTTAIGAAAQDAAMNAIGASKRFLNNPMKEAKMRQTAQTLLDENIIGYGSTAKGLAHKISNLAETSGKAIGKHLQEIGANNNFILPQQFKVAIEDLRPVQQSTGKVLRGGEYDFANKRIDNALETIDAHGDNPISFEEANQLKGTLQDAANWQSNKEATVLDRMIAGRVRETLDNALDQTSQQIEDITAHQEFLKNKQRYSAAMNAQDPIYNRISSEIGNDKIGLTDYILAAGAITQGNIGEAMALLGGKKLARTFGPSSAAKVLNKVNNLNIKSLGLMPGKINAASTLGLGSNNDRGSPQ